MLLAIFTENKSSADYAQRRGVNLKGSEIKSYQIYIYGLCKKKKEMNLRNPRKVAHCTPMFGGIRSEHRVV
jgi:hypothetical protein